MTTEEIIIYIFCSVDDNLPKLQQHSQAKLYPSELVTIGILFALRGGHFRAFYRWLKRDFESLFGGLPHRTRLLRLLKTHQAWCSALLASPSFFTVMDTYPIELLFPIREGRSDQQVGKKGKDKGRWIIGIKLCWLLNESGQVVAWDWNTANTSDKHFHPLVEPLVGQTIVLADLGFRSAEGYPENLKLCPKGTWNERMIVETVLSMVTVVCDLKRLRHRLKAYIHARLAFVTAMFNVLVGLFHQIHPQADVLKISIAEFAL
ncbi:transposase [Candidatus Poribacteria bacterium]|nr:transposase [Candidatus Poribacteria bacterium]